MVAIAACGGKDAAFCHCMVTSTRFQAHRLLNNGHFRQIPQPILMYVFGSRLQYTPLMRAPWASHTISCSLSAGLPSGTIGIFYESSVIELRSEYSRGMHPP
jgi:hypothetical protein